MALFNIENLTFSYPLQEKPVLEGVSLDIYEGEFTVLCGQSGCGKTTLMRLLKNELRPRGELGGKILYCGKDLLALDERTSAAEIGFVLQDPESQIVTDRVWHELSFGLESLGADRSYIRRRVSETASFFGMEKLFRSETAFLSGGQKQLLSLAAVMAMSPKVLLLDEPTSQLDPIAAAEFISTLSKINREFGTAIVIAEHRLEELFPICDRAIVMENGRIIADGTPREVSQGLDSSHPMLCSMPSAVRIYAMSGGKGDCPLTVKEGRDYLEKNAGNEIRSLPSEKAAVSGEAAVEMKDVRFRYERKGEDILRGVTLKIGKGEIYTILGGNGSGKTTTLNVMAALRKHYSGTVRIFGKKTSEYGSSLYRRGISFLPQNPAGIFLKNSVREDFGDICKICGYDEKESREIIDGTVEKLEIAHLLDRHPYDLSGGEQQKCAIAKCLMSKPKILLMDEPTKGIDAFAKNSLSGIIRGLKREGVTVVIVSHDVEFAGEISDRCAMFFDGEIICEDSACGFFSGNNYYTTAANRITRGFYDNAVTCGQAAELIRLNGEKNG